MIKISHDSKGFLIENIEDPSSNTLLNSYKNKSGHVKSLSEPSNTNSVLFLLAWSFFVHHGMPH